MNATLEARVQRLEDEREILRTLYTYGHAIDYGYEEEFVGCWIEDGLLVWPGVGEIRGREALGVVFRLHTHAPDVVHKHFLSQPLIRFEDGRARVDSMFARLDPYPEGPQMKGFGRYRDVLVPCDDGRWRFETRRAEGEAGRPGATPTVSKAAFDEAMRARV